MKTNIKIIIGVAIGIALSTTLSYCLAATLIDSKNVYYKDNSNLLADNVQDAIDGTCTKFASKVDNFLDKIYPVGSVYISTTLDTPEQVKTALGGEWAVYGKGQTLVGIDTSQTEFNTIGKTGGAKSISYTPSGTIGSTGLTISQIPSHSHSFTPSGSVTSTFTGSQVNTSTTGNHSHTTGMYQASPYKYTYGSQTDGLAFWGSTYAAASSTTGNHYHTVTAAGTVSSTFTGKDGTTGAAGKGTTSDGHTHSFTGTTDSINNLQPYITVYMYKRIS